MASDEFFKTLIDRVETFKGEVGAATDIAAAVEKQARAAIEKAETAEEKVEALKSALLELVMDVFTISILALIYAFLESAVSHPKEARRTKDSTVKYLRAEVSNPAIANGIEKHLTSICDMVEKELL